MSQSEQVDQIYTALALAQKVIKNPITDAKNPHFKSKYTTLAAVTDSIRVALSTQGIAAFHTTEVVPRHDGTEIEYFTTTFGHTSGQWIRSNRRIPPGLKVQEYGAWLTYNRRYAICSMAGVAAEEDDDGNLANTANADVLVNNLLKRENPNVNKPGDFVDKAEYEDGDLDRPINNIPKGNPELKKLGKKDADVLINNLRVKMKYATNKMALKAWGEQVKDEVETLPDQHRVQIREDYADRWNELP